MSISGKELLDARATLTFRFTSRKNKDQRGFRLWVSCGKWQQIITTTTITDETQTPKEKKKEKNKKKNTKKEKEAKKKKKKEKKDKGTEKENEETNEVIQNSQIVEADLDFEKLKNEAVMSGKMVCNSDKYQIVFVVKIN